MALGRNFRVESARLGPDEARGGLLRERGAFDPEIVLEYERSEDGSSQQLDPRIAQGRTDELFLQDEYEAGIAGDLPWGMDYDIGISTRNRRGDFNRFRSEYDTFAGITVRQPLLRGFGTDSAMAGIRRARVDLADATWELADETVDIVTRTVLVFHDLVLARETLAVAEKSKALTQRLLDDNMERAAIGVMTPLDVTSARAEVASRQEAVLEAARNVLQTRNELLRLITRQLARPGASRPVEPARPPRLDPISTDADGLLARALGMRPDYRRALLALRGQRIQLAFEENQALPRLDLVASFGVNGLDRQVAESFERAFDEGNTEWTAGMVFRMPLPNRAGRGSVLENEVRLARLLIDAKRLEQDISVEIANALERVRTARELIAATRTSRELSEERLDAEQEKLKAGTSTTFVVLELQKDLAEAEVRELRALIDYNKEVAELDRACGLTLVRHGVAIEGLADAMPAARTPPGSDPDSSGP